MRMHQLNSIPVNILAFTYDVQRVMPALNPTPKHPSRIHTAQKTSSTASAFRPKRLQKAVTDDGHQQLVAFADDDPGSITGRVKVGEIKNSTIRVPTTIGSKVRHGEFG